MSCFIIAEAGVNHNGDLDRALQLIDVAKEAGADAVKFQTFTVEAMVTKTAEKAEYQETEQTESQYEMLKKLALEPSMFHTLKKHADELGIEFLSTPFDSSSVKLLAHDLKMRRIKVSSGDLTNGPLLLEIARTGLPIILSTGMATIDEIRQALSVLAYGYVNKQGVPDHMTLRAAYESFPGHKALLKNVTLLHCTTEYPTPMNHVNLRAMDALKEAFLLPVGYSDHTQGVLVAPVAVARGAVVIEKHYTMDRNLPGPDHAASLEPDELKTMVENIRMVEAVLGTDSKKPTQTEMANREVARKKVVAAKPIKYGEVFSPENLTVKRAAGGVCAMEFWSICGQAALHDYNADDVVETRS